MNGPPQILPPRYRSATAGVPAVPRSATVWHAALMSPLTTASVNGREPAGSAICESPVFVLTASRSGSTLLRFILDSHPDLACPPETSVASAAAALARTWDILDRAPSGSTPVTDAGAPAQYVIDAVRESVDGIYGHYLQRRGKRRWCDKSLDSYMVAELITMLYPQAKFVCLYRHCMDMIASGMEACPWGLSRFGFDPFVAQHPGNGVAAIGSYWLTTVQAIMEFEARHPEVCYRIRYEDLVTAPEETAAAMFSFLGAEPAPGIAQAAFRMPHESNGPSDEKIWFSDDVTDASIGRGYRVPAAALPPPLRQAINETLAKLDYRQVDDQWDAQTGPSDPRTAPPPQGEQPADRSGDPRPRAGDEEIETVAHAIAQRMASQRDSRPPDSGHYWSNLAGATIAAVVQAASGAHQQVRWRFTADGGVQAADGDDESAASFIARPATWQALLNRESNMITEITAGRVRCVNKRDTHRIRSDELHAIGWLLGLTHIPLARAGDVAPGAGESETVAGLAR